MREINPIGLRLPNGIRERLKIAAACSNRSLNSQILSYVLQGLRLDGFEVPRDQMENARAAVTARASVSLPTQ